MLTGMTRSKTNQKKNPAVKGDDEGGLCHHPTSSSVSAIFSSFVSTYISISRKAGKQKPMKNIFFNKL